MSNILHQHARNINADAGDKFLLRVMSIDQNETIDDLQKQPKLAHLSELSAIRNLHIAGWKVNPGGGGQAYVDIVVPQTVLGEFKMPQIGDIVWVEMSKKGIRGEVATKLYSTYDGAAPEDGGNPVPLWGSQPGDYGYLYTYKDHNVQYSPKINDHKLPNVAKAKKASFRTKWVRSITGYRFRRYYKSNVKPGKFVLRGDGIFDIDRHNLNLPLIIEDGIDMLAGQAKAAQSEYPNPLNAPQKREEDPDFKYEYIKYKYLSQKFPTDPFTEGDVPLQDVEATTFTLKNLNYTSYEPIMDKSYREKTKGFERELQAVDEWQTAVKGNNKILIQDVHGDGENLMMMFKNALDAGLAMIQNGERGQVRFRDHLGQSYLFDADPERPRVIITTFNRQIFEMGSVKDKGSFVYWRNGEAWGDSDTPWGRKTGKQKSNVFNQEFLMVDDSKLIEDKDFKNRFSPKFGDTLKGPGIYHRTVDDSTGKYEKTYSSFEKDGTLIEKSLQKWGSSEVSTLVKLPSEGQDAIWEINSKVDGKRSNTLKADKSRMIFDRFTQSGEHMGSVTLNDTGIIVDTEPKFKIQIGATTKTIVIGNPSANITFFSSSWTSITKTFDIIKG